MEACVGNFTWTVQGIRNSGWSNQGVSHPLEEDGAVPCDLIFVCSFQDVGTIKNPNNPSLVRNSSSNELTLSWRD